jgi:hypothetical protein
MLGRRPIAAMLAAIVAAALSGMDTGTYVEAATKLPTMEVSIRSPRQHHRRRPSHKRLDQRRVVVGRARTVHPLRYRPARQQIVRRRLEQRDSAILRPAGAVRAFQDDRHAVVLRCSIIEGEGGFGRSF